MPAKIRTVVIAIAIAVFAGAPAIAQAPPSVSSSFFAAADIPGTVGKALVSGASFRHQAYLRTNSGDIEIHRDWNDTILVQEGRATILVGGDAAGGRETAPGEIRGGTAAGAKTQVVAPGDILFIPAGMAHQIILAPGTKAFRYFAFKSRP